MFLDIGEDVFSCGEAVNFEELLQDVYFLGSERVVFLAVIGEDIVSCCDFF